MEEELTFNEFIIDVCKLDLTNIIAIITYILINELIN